METVAELLEEGNSPDVAADYVGISSTTFYSWLRRGAEYEELVDSGDHNPDDEKYYTFLREVRQARALYARKTVRNLNAAGPGMWLKYLTILERKDRKGWGHREEVVNIDDAPYNPNEEFL